MSLIFNIRNNILSNNTTLEILNLLINSHSNFFTAKSIRYDFFKQYGIILRGRPREDLFMLNDFHTKMVLGTKIGHIIRKLHSLGFIEHVNRAKWKKIKKIDLNCLELYSQREITNGFIPQCL